MKTARRLPIHCSLTRPLLLAGGERKLVMFNYTLIAVLLFGAGLNPFTILTAVILAIIGHAGLGKLAKYDVNFMAIYLHYRQYQSWYPAQACIRQRYHPVKSAIS